MVLRFWREWWRDLRGRSPETGTLLLLALVISAPLNCWLRGPVFGILPFLLFTFIPVATCAWLLSRLRDARYAAVTVVALVAVATSWFFCAPPSTARLFSNGLGMDIPAEISEIQRWNDNWARDPSFHLRFSADPETIATLVDRARLSGPGTGPASPPNRRLLAVPEWWRPHEIDSLQSWSRDTNGAFAVRLYYDTDAQVAYLDFTTF